MKIALVNTNTILPPLSPIGLLTLAAFLRDRGHDVSLADPLAANGRSALGPGVIAALRRGPRPQLIGFSIRNIDTTQMMRSRNFLPEILALIRSVRTAFPRVPVVLGGAGFSLAPLDILEATGAEYGVVGEGERALDALTRGLETGTGAAGIPGLAFKGTAGEYLLNPVENAESEFLSRLPLQAIDLVDYDAYFKLSGTASVQTKRGCALSCAYCTYPLIEGRTYRLIDPARVVDEIEFLAGRGYDYFHFADSVFNVPRRHALAICREIVRRNLRVRWHAYMSPFRFDGELLDRLLQAGCDGVQFGVDACSERMLRVFGKNFNKADIYRAAGFCRRKEMEFGLNILIGMPGETSATVGETLAALDELKPTAAFITQGIRVYRGTPLHARLVDEGSVESGAPLLEPFYFFSNRLPRGISKRLLDFARARDYVYCDAAAKPPHTDRAAMELYRGGFRGPMWKILKKIREAVPA